MEFPGCVSFRHEVNTQEWLRPNSNRCRFESSGRIDADVFQGFPLDALDRAERSIGDRR
jgi:hypothetical protein